MRMSWKVLLGAALVVPMVSYVAGSLVAADADDPAPRETIHLRPAAPTTAPTTATPDPTPSPTPSADDDDVEVITPEYDDLEDDDHGGDDHSGEDDSSGHGSGHDDGGDDHSGHGGED
jgi:hypothetical protein